MPRGEQFCRIPTEDQEKLVARMQPPQLAQRVHRVRDAVAADLDVRHFETFFIIDRQAAHLDTLLRIRDGRGSVRWHRGRNEQDTIEPRAVSGRARRCQVAEVDGVERPAQDADPHGWYSNSTPAMRTVSPGFTPAASSARFTPMRSRED